MDLNGRRICASLVCADYSSKVNIKHFFLVTISVERSIRISMRYLCKVLSKSITYPFRVRKIFTINLQDR